MVVQVRHRGIAESTTYRDVVKVSNCYNDDKVFCFRLHMSDGSTATFNAAEWRAFQQTNLRAETDPGALPKWKQIF